VNDDPCVISLNSYEIQIANNEFEATFAFRVSDMEFVFHNSGSEFISNIMKHAKLEQIDNKNRKI
jgi:hypothetical protein